MADDIFSTGAAAGGRFDTGLTLIENLAAGRPEFVTGKSSSKKLRKLSILRGIQAANQREAQEKGEARELQRKRDRFGANAAAGRTARLAILPGSGESAFTARSLLA